MELESPPQRSNTSSPEFEFWMVGKNHPESKPDLHTADELFNEGVLLPLHLIASQNHSSSPQLNTVSAPQVDDPPPPSPTSPADPDPPAPQPSASSSPTLISSKRWKDIFRKKDSNTPKKKERKPTGSAAAELNINIWPFSRSRSAGTAAAGTKAAAAAAAAAMRKSSSAPCSRSNSRRAGTGVHVGRSSPVWQARRAGKGPAKEKRDLSGGMKGLNLNLKVNSCIGYGGAEGGCRSEEGGGGGLIKFKALFSKKVY